MSLSNIKTYSQYYQDVIAFSILNNLKDGTFVDVGAHDGRYLSNTLLLEEKGWTGICVEPIKSLFDDCQKLRKNSKCYNVAIYESEGEVEFQENTGYTSGLSGIVSEYDPRHLSRVEKENDEHSIKPSMIKVQTRRLDDILRENDVKRVHYLSIDVEGAELKVLKSINFEEVFIDLIDFEANYPEQAQEIVNFLLEKGFILMRLPVPSIDIFMINQKSEYFKLISGT